MIDLLGDDLPAAAAEHLADRADAWPQTLADMVDVLIDEISHAEPTLPPGRIRALAVRVVARQCTEYGGQKWYWMRSDALRRALRDMQMWAEYDGTVHGRHGLRALARRYGPPGSALSDNAVYAIIRRERARHRALVQPALDLPDPR